MAYRPFSADDAIAAAEAALSRALGESCRIEDAIDIGGEGRRNLILRARCASGRDARPIVIKATRAATYDPNAADAYAKSGFAREWAAAAYLANVMPPSSHRPALLASDVANGVIVFADLGADATPLVEPLLRGTAAAAERALSAYAIALARLHAATIGCREAHAAIFCEGFANATLRTTASEEWIESVTKLQRAHFHAEAPRDELLLISNRLREPGPWQALVHADPCPDNVLLDEHGRATLIDFEFARPGHALIDALYWRIAFPTCWCAGTTPSAVADRIDGIYRAAVARAVPAARDERAFREESAFVATDWLLGSLGWLLEPAWEEDRSWGISTNRARILSYLDTAIGMCAAAEVLPGMRQAALAWRAELRARWPETAPLAPYPAFAGAS